jgi:hypothetical protein
MADVLLVAVAISMHTYVAQYWGIAGPETTFTIKFFLKKKCRLVYGNFMVSGTKMFRSTFRQIFLK